MKNGVTVTVLLLASLYVPGLIGACPDQTAVDLLKHNIAYQRTEEMDPLRGLPVIHVDVWMRSPVTGFYIRDPLRDFIPTVRMSYLYGAHGWQGGGTCPITKEWQKCVEDFAADAESPGPVTTCVISLDTGSIPSWEPSPSSQTKRRIVGELRREIEQKWQGVSEIVIRDFNVKDNQITMYLRMPDGDYYQGCAFHAERETQCEGWHLFGQAPVSSLHKWVFERPYRLK